MSEEQPDFDFFAEGSEPLGTSPCELSMQLLHQAVLSWLLGRNPSGYAFGVPTRMMKYQADLAAFWSSPRKKLLQPDVTMIIEMRTDRDNCWPDCGNHDELLELLREARLRQTAMEEDIRRKEPSLRDTDTLFAEFQRWDYSKSTDAEYHKCRRQVEKLEHALYKGSRFEQLRQAHVADFHYLAVPEGTVLETELAYGWGLLHIGETGLVKVVREAMWRDCPEPNRMHLIQNIAATATRDVMFARGVKVEKCGNIVFTSPPRRRRKVEKEYRVNE